MDSTRPIDPDTPTPTSTALAVQEDYFGVADTHRTILPDNVSFIEWKVMNEGERRRYLNATNREVKLQKGGDTVIGMRPGDDRWHLLTTAIVGWNLKRAGQDVTFSRQQLEEWLNVAPPRIVDLVEKDIRRGNPWLLAEMTVEDIDKEIASLQEMRETKIKELEGKGV